MFTFNHTMISFAVHYKVAREQHCKTFYTKTPFKCYLQQRPITYPTKCPPIAAVTIKHQIMIDRSVSGAGLTDRYRK